MNIRLKTRKFKELSQLSKVHHRNSNEMILIIWLIWYYFYIIIDKYFIFLNIKFRMNKHIVE